MGKGDRKTRKGKIWRGSYGVLRPSKKPTPVASDTAPKTDKKN
jgi:30S ribosomal protein S31